jgi:hypothetical protein
VVKRRPAVAAARRPQRGQAFTGEGRLSRPSRCALPITALRVTPSPSISAIWVAVMPPSQPCLSFAMRSSVQAMVVPALNNR